MTCTNKLQPVDLFICLFLVSYAYKTNYHSFTLKQYQFHIQHQLPFLYPKAIGTIWHLYFFPFLPQTSLAIDVISYKAK